MSRSEEFAAGHGYRGNHRPPALGDDVGSPMHDLTHNLPSDVYDRPGLYTGHNEPELRRQIRSARGKPEAPVKMYRALPEAHHAINPGDWVTPSLSYARQHAESEGPGLHVIAAPALAKHLVTHGDDLQEFGYQGPKPVQGKVAWKDRKR